MTGNPTKTERCIGIGLFIGLVLALGDLVMGFAYPFYAVWAAIMAVVVPLIAFTDMKDER